VSGHAESFPSNGIRSASTRIEGQYHRPLAPSAAHCSPRGAAPMSGFPGSKQLLDLADVVALLLAKNGHPIELRGRRTGAAAFEGPDELVSHHFETRSEAGHVNRDSLRDTLDLLGGKASLILETGSSAWGTDSSTLFDSYVASFGGEFHTVDIRTKPMLTLRRRLTARSTMCCDDSVRFLERWVDRNPGRQADLVYLDSWDLDVSAPVEAAIHGLREFFAVASALGPGSLLLIDDTPADPDWFPVEAREAGRAFESTYGMIPGKGMLVDRCLAGRPDVTKVHHRYQALYRF
jgi:hypothetical protein